MNRRTNARNNRNQQGSNIQQQYDQSFVSGGNNQQQQQQQQFDPPQEQNENENQDQDQDNGEETGGSKIRRFFGNRKNLTPAERKRLDKQRKQRQLQRLRKMLSPKNAVVALHELQGPGMGEFVIHTNGQQTTAEIVVNNVRYEATANSKHQAKSRASEKALRDLVIAQMAKAQNGSNNGTGNGNASSEDVEMTDVSSGEQDGVPMLHLASFALYKLFNEWQNEGFEIPAIKPTKGGAKVAEDGTNPAAPKSVKTKADLPADAATRHPTSLLAFMRPQIPYEDLGSNNSPDPTKREYSFGVTVDGQKFIGKARTKKNARKEAAAAACKAVFGVNFVKTETA